MTDLLSFLTGLKDLSGLKIQGASAELLPLVPAALLVILCLLGLVLLVTSYVRINAPTSPHVRLGLLAARIALFLVVALCLLHPIFTIEARRLVKGQIPILLDSSQSMTIQDLDGRSRFQVGEETARQIAETLGELHEPKLYLFSEDAAPHPLSEGVPLPHPTGRQTDIAGALSRVRRELRGLPMDGIILITDGINNCGKEPVEEACNLGIPVYVAGVGGSPRGPDLMISDVQANPFPFRSDVSTVRAALRASNCQERLAGEVLLKGMGKTLGSCRFEISASTAKETVVELGYVPTRTGPLELVLEAIADVEDQAPQNNRWPLHVHVASNKIRVLMVDGRPRWEFGFLRRALTADPHVTVMSEVWVAPDMVYKQSDAYTQMEKGVFPRSIRELSQFDVVVVGDVKRSVFAVSQLFDLEDFVAEQGGGLIFLGGQNTMGSEQQYAKAPLAKLLPFTYTGQEKRIDGGVRLHLTDQGLGHPLMRLHEARKPRDGAWGNLPALWGCWSITQVKPSALVLASFRRIGQDEARPAILVNRYGRGRVLAFAADSSWRWSLNPGEETEENTSPEDAPNAHHQFWLNAVRWASGEVSDPEQRVFVTTDRAECSAGETVHVLARVLDDAHCPEIDAVVSATVRLGSEEVTRMQFEQDPGSRGFYRSSFKTEKTGSYLIRVEASKSGEGVELPSAECEIAVVAANREFMEIAFNESLLMTIAEKTGGKFFAPTNAGNIAAEIQKTAPSVSAALEVDPLDAPLTWILFVGLLCGEWIFRKMRGLA